MVEVHANPAPEASLKFKGGLAPALLWPYRRPTQIIMAITCIIAIAGFVRDPDFGLGFWALCFACGFFYMAALLRLTAQLLISEAQLEAVRRFLSERGCTLVSAAEPETWRLPAPPWVKPTDPGFNVTLKPATRAMEGPFVFLFAMSRRLRGAGER
jgi:hypothetical protein